MYAKRRLIIKSRHSSKQKLTYADCVFMLETYIGHWILEVCDNKIVFIKPIRFISKVPSGRQVGKQTTG